MFNIMNEDLKTMSDEEKEIFQRLTDIMMDEKTWKLKEITTLNQLDSELAKDFKRKGAVITIAVYDFDFSEYPEVQEFSKDFYGVRITPYSENWMSSLGAKTEEEILAKARDLMYEAILKNSWFVSPILPVMKDDKFFLLHAIGLGCVNLEERAREKLA